MKIEDLLLEVPQRIDVDFALDDYDKNRKEAERLIKKSKTSKLLRKDPYPFNAPEEDLFLFEFPLEIALVKTTSAAQEVLYYVRYENPSRVKLLGKGRCIQQIYVWRRLSEIKTKDLASHIFFNQLLPKTGCIVTDLKQTQKGESFWYARVAEALNNPKYFVYFVSFSNPVEIIELKNRTDFDKIVNKTWGDSNNFRHKRIIISNRKLGQQ